MILTSVHQREAIYRQHQAGESYSVIAKKQHRSKECVRYWCRRQRDGGRVETVYPVRRLLAGFDPRVKYVILRLRLEHPKWGPGPIRFHLARQASLAGLALPSRAQIGRYLHQWPRFRRPPRHRSVAHPAEPVERVHQCWQLDFKVQLALADAEVQLFTATDAYSGACVGSQLFATPGPRPLLENVLTFLRSCFSLFGRPEVVQTDGEAVLAGRPGEHYFPTRFTLWLRGLGIVHRVNPAGKPTRNAEVERCHRTLNEYALTHRKPPTFAQANPLLEQAWQELVYELPSQAKNCQGQPPVSAYPALLEAHRPYHPDLEVALFSLPQVDSFLAEKTWVRQVEKSGQLTIGEQRKYLVGRKYAGQSVCVRFDPSDRSFVFYRGDPKSQEALDEIGRKPARGLAVADLVGGLGPFTKPFPLQLPLPLFWPDGVNVKEQVGVLLYE